MLKAFSVRNFKCIRDSGKIEVKPLTIFIGPNSSGKSSILQFLLVLKQTVEAIDSESPFSTYKREGYVDVGSYEDYIFKNEKDGSLSFKLYFEGKTTIETETIIRYKKDEVYVDSFTVDLDGNTIKINSKGEIEQNLINESLLTGISKASSKGNTERLMSEILGVLPPSFGKEQLFRRVKFYYIFPRFHYVPFLSDFYDIRKSLKKKESEVHESVSAAYETETRDEEKEISEYLASIKIFSKSIEDLEFFPHDLSTTFENLFYVGPLREHPQRYYFISGEKPIHVGTKGERAVEVLYVTAKTSKSVFQKISYWFRKLGFGEVSVESITESLYILLVSHPTIKKGHQDLQVNIASVGFGASQILPVIVEGFYAPQNAIIIIEQPEIHLHPRLQAEMGDLLIDIAKTGKRLIIETHSEHMLLRIQRRIAEGLIPKEDVAVYYFELKEDGAEITQLELDRFGRFSNWPEGFFEEDLKEAYEHSKVIAEKIEKEGTA
jgi:predicted ATPase